jgi:hypothetical protein
MLAMLAMLAMLCGEMTSNELVIEYNNGGM